MQKIILAIVIPLLAAGCIKRQAASGVLISSNHSTIYEASIKNVTLTYTLDDYVDWFIATINTAENGGPILDPEMIRTSLSTPESLAAMEDEFLEQQINFLVGSLKGAGGNISQKKVSLLGKTSSKVSAKSGKMVDKTTLVYDVSFLLTIPNQAVQPTGQSMQAYVPIDMDVSARRQLAATYHGCFDAHLDELAATQATFLPMMMFYYFKGEGQGCELKGTSAWQPVTLATQLSPRQMTEKRYPEINRIWEDKKFVATIIFTPTGDYNDADEGIYDYALMAQKIVSKYGQPSEGPLPAELTGAKRVARPTLRPNITLTYQEDNGRSMVFHLMAWQENWQSDLELKNTFGLYSKESDYISYNGHADYGNNVKLMEEWSQVTAGQYQVFYLDGCSTFAYIKNEMLQKVKMMNPTDEPTKHLDIIANVSPSYFMYMPEQNIHLIEGMVKGDKAYTEMFAEIEKSVNADFSSRIIVIGEEDNVYKP